MKEFEGTKLKILKTAKRLFANNGYSATPISQIAVECGITKSLVFYHFNRKKNILKSIIDFHFKQFKNQRDKMISNLTEEFSNGNIENSDKIFVEKIVELMLNEEDFWKLMFYEIIRDKEVWEYFKNFIRMWHEDLFSELEKKGIIIKNKKKFIFQRMFNVIGPIMLYTIKKDEWNKYFDIDENTAKNTFIRNLKKIIKDDNIGRGRK